MQIARAAALIIFFSAVGCSRVESFDAAIAQATTAGIAGASAVGEGLPHFLPHTLTPVWPDDVNTAVVTLPNFTLRDAHDTPLNLAECADTPTIIAFFFASCSGVCPTLIQTLQQIDAALEPAHPARIVAITVDPELDTPAQLAVYAQAHGLAAHPRIMLATGARESIYALIRDTFASDVRRVSRDDLRQFAHTEHFYVFDTHCQLRAVLNGTRRDVAAGAVRTVQALAQE